MKFNETLSQNRTDRAVFLVDEKYGFLASHVYDRTIALVVLWKLQFQ